MDTDTEGWDINTEALKLDLCQLVDRLSLAQRQHFHHAVQQVADCYLKPEQHGALLINSTAEASQSLVAINASNEQVTEMLGFMSQVIGQAAEPSRSPYLN